LFGITEFVFARPEELCRHSNPNYHRRHRENCESFHLFNSVQRPATDSEYGRSPDGKYHHYQEPCSHLKQYIVGRRPRGVARNLTQRLMNRFSICYTNLINDGRLKSAREEIGPSILKAV
jgi:hypothetical protein